LKERALRPGTCNREKEDLKKLFKKKRTGGKDAKNLTC